MAGGLAVPATPGSARPKSNTLSRTPARASRSNRDSLFGRRSFCRRIQTRGDLCRDLLQQAEPPAFEGAMTTHENYYRTPKPAALVVNSRTTAAFAISSPSSTSTSPVVIASCFPCDSGDALVIMPAFEVQAFLRAIQEMGVSTCSLVPAVYWLAINKPQFRIWTWLISDGYLRRSANSPGAGARIIGSIPQSLGSATGSASRRLLGCNLPSSRVRALAAIGRWVSGAPVRGHRSLRAGSCHWRRGSCWSRSNVVKAME